VRRIGNVTETIFARTINVFLDQIPANLLHVVPIQSAMQTDKATLYVLVYLDTLLNLTQSQDAPELRLELHHQIHAVLLHVVGTLGVR